MRFGCCGWKAGSAGILIRLISAFCVVARFVVGAPERAEGADLAALGACAEMLIGKQVNAPIKTKTASVRKCAFINRFIAVAAPAAGAGHWDAAAVRLPCVCFRSLPRCGCFPRNIGSPRGEYPPWS